MNKLSTLCVILIGIPSLLHAQAITGDIPYAKKLLEENDNRKLKAWTLSEIRNDTAETINPGGSNTEEKDKRSNPDKLGYHSLDVEKDENAKEFSGDLDLTNAVFPAKIAILVDDIAVLIVKEIERKAGVDGPVFEDKFEVNGTALWNPRSYKEFSTNLPPGRKYKLDLIYSNTANLTPKYVGGVDIDGVSVYVSLIPIEVNSMDKFLAGSLDQSVVASLGGEAGVGLEFRNINTGESYRYDSIADTFVYNNPYTNTEEGEDAWLSQEEVAMGMAGSDSEGRLSQDVIFFRDQGRLHFRTIFDSAGEIEIAIIQNGEEIGFVTHELVEDEDMGDLLDTVDEILSDEWGDGPVVAAARADYLAGKLSVEDYAALRETHEEVLAGESKGRRAYKKRNASTKVAISIWDRFKDNFEDGIRKAADTVKIAIRIAALTGKGFVEGAWMGVKEDAQGFVDLVKMIANPEETAKTFYEGFKVLIALDLEGWKNVGSTLVSSFLTKGKEGAGEWVQPTGPDVAAYLVGFTCGYISEQVAVSYLTAGALKAGNIGAKIAQFIRNAAKKVKPALGNVTDVAKVAYLKAMKAKNSIYRSFSQDVVNPDDVKALKRMMDDLSLSCPIPAG